MTKKFIIELTEDEAKTLLEGKLEFWNGGRDFWNVGVTIREQIKEQINEIEHSVIEKRVPLNDYPNSQDSDKA